MQEIHVDAKSFRDRWKNCEPWEKGGQGTSKVATSSTDEKIFIKILNKQKDPNRRSRMYREITALETLDHPRIPKLIETNVRQYHDHSYDLYLATEFVEGSTLAQWREDRVVSLTDALSIVNDLVDVIDYAHANQVLHRDIKPDNIIMTIDSGIMLVDFGMAYHDLGDDTLETAAGEAIGNRFMILPEYQINSNLKNDARSDLTCIIGILFYLLTGKFPAVLADQSGAMPHQRGVLFPEDQRADLMAFFGRGFQYEIDRRFQSIEALKEDLGRLNAGPSILAQTSDELLNRVLAKAADPLELADLEIQNKFRSIYDQVTKLSQQLQRTVGDTIVLSWTGGGVDLEKGVQTFRIGFKKATRQAGPIWPIYEVRSEGTEFVVTAAFENSPPLRIRLPIADPTLNSTAVEQLKTYLLRGIEVLFADPG